MESKWCSICNITQTNVKVTETPIYLFVFVSFQQLKRIDKLSYFLIIFLRQLSMHTSWGSAVPSIGRNVNYFFLLCTKFTFKLTNISFISSSERRYNKLLNFQAVRLKSSIMSVVYKDINTTYWHKKNNFWHWIVSYE